MHQLLAMGTYRRYDTAAASWSLQSSLQLASQYTGSIKNHIIAHLK